MEYQDQGERTVQRVQRVALDLLVKSDHLD